MLGSGHILSINKHSESGISTITVLDFDSIIALVDSLIEGCFLSTPKEIIGCATAILAVWDCYCARTAKMAVAHTR